MEAMIQNVVSHLQLSQNISSTSVFISIALILFCVLYFYYESRGLPPGPIGLPILGYWPFLNDETCYLQLQKQQEKYGDVFSFRCAGTLILNLGSIHALREVHLGKADCFERVSSYNLFAEYFKDGIVYVNGEKWKILRKFTIQQMKELGMTNLKESVDLHDSIQETIQLLRSKNGEPVDILQVLAIKCNAIIRSTLFRQSCITEQEIIEFNESYTIALGFGTAKNLLLIGNIARYFIFPFKSGFKEALKHHNNMRRILFEIVERHKNSFNADQPRNYIDAFFKEKLERKNKGDPTTKYFTDDALVDTLDQIVGDGVLGVAAFVVSFLKYVVELEEEQEKMYKELIEVIGPERDPVLLDKTKLPYTNALIQEITRVTNFFQMFPSQQCIKECTVRGYKIPKGTITLMNIWACHNNPVVYEEPEKFNPYRFLPEDGKPKAEPPVSFGIGRRSCIGEAFAMAQTFLFLVTIVKHFKLSIPGKAKDSPYDLVLNGMEMCAHPRV